MEGMMGQAPPIELSPTQAALEAAMAKRSTHSSLLGSQLDSHKLEADGQTVVFGIFTLDLSAYTPCCAPGYPGSWGAGEKIKTTHNYWGWVV